MSARENLTRPVRVLLVDDHQVVRSGLRRLIELEDDLVVVGEAGTAGEAVLRAERDSPDLVVMDVRLPDRSGISACCEITSKSPGVRVLIFTSYADDVALAASLTAGASGYLLKSVRGADLVGTMRRVIAGESAFEQTNRTTQPRPLLADLSPQERDLAAYLAKGMTNREIANRMGLAEKTVKNYVSNILTKLGMARRSEAAAYVARVEAMEGSSPRSLSDYVPTIRPHRLTLPGPKVRPRR